MAGRSVGSPHQHIIELGWGYLYSAALNAVAELGVADLLEHGPQPSAALAEQLDVQAQPLHRTLRLLASVGVFAEDEQGRWTLTPAADVLRSEAAGSLREYLIRNLTGDAAAAARDESWKIEYLDYDWTLNDVL